MNVQTDAVAEAVSEVFAIPAGDDHLPCQRIDLLRRALVILQSLDADLRSLGRDTLVFGGLGLETAVYSTMTGANDRGYECLALIDACAPHDPAVAERALSSITMSGGIFGAVGTSAALCAALAVPGAGTEERSGT